MSTWIHTQSIGLGALALPVLSALALSTPAAAAPGVEALSTSSSDGDTSLGERPAAILPVIVDRDPDAYVVGGEDAAPGAWPDAATVSGQCTGTLIAPRWVLTAGHCIGRNSFVGVGFVSYNEFRENELPREEMAAVEVIDEMAHPDYRGGGHDIGLLELAEPVTTVEPRVIGRDCVTEEWLEKGSEVAIVGWGATRENGSGYTDSLQEGYAKVQTPDCADEYVKSLGQDIYTGCDPSSRPGGEIGAGGEGVDACFGDSGGPLYLNTPTGWYLVGVTSRAYLGVPQSAPCKYGGIYTRPDSVIDWIEDTIGRELPRPICSLPPEVVAERIAVKQKKSRTVEVTVDDPDSASYTVEIAEPPVHGSAEVNKKGEVVYTAPDDYEGADPFTLRVVDDGNPDWPDNPPAETLTTVQVDVFKGKPSEELKPYVQGCGCSQGGAGGMLLLPLSALSLVRRRRRT